MKPISVTSDYVFKGILSDPGRCKDFLTCMLVGQNKTFPPNTAIEEITYVETEYIQKKRPEVAKKMVLDLQVRTNVGFCIVEIQTYRVLPWTYLKRMGMYSSLAVAVQGIKKGAMMNDYKKIEPVVVVSVIDGFKLLDDDHPCISHHETFTTKLFEKTVPVHFYVTIELEKFDANKQDNSIDERTKDWLYFLKTGDLAKPYKNEQVESAVKFVRHIQDNHYGLYVQDIMSDQNMVDIIEAAIEDGKKEGKEEAQKEGQEEGKEEGKKEGIEQTIRQMLLAGVDPQLVATATGMTESEVEKLKDFKE